MIGINYVGKRKERLANQMFQYAAVKGIAKNRGYNWCVPPSNWKSSKDDWQEHQLFQPFKLTSSWLINFSILCLLDNFYTYSVKKISFLDLFLQ